MRQRLLGAELANTIYRGVDSEPSSEIDGVSFALVHVDVDLYQPTLDSNSFFYPR